MTASAITPLLVPSSAPHTQQRSAVQRGPLPLVAMPALRPIDAAVYGMAAMDDRGRITDRPVLSALGWIPGTSVHVEAKGDVAAVTAGCGGTGQVTAPGRIRLPASVRHRLDLRPGDRLLLVGRPAASLLLLYPPTALDALLASTELWPPAGPA